jgi:hypothetical protein
MITKNTATKTTNGFRTEYHYADACNVTIGPRGGKTTTVEIWRANGTVKTWKTRPNDFRIPVKHGLCAYGYIDQDNGHLFHTSDDPSCPLNAS